MVLAIIQARMGSTRLPGKVLKPLAGMPAIEHVVRRVRKADTVNDCLVATSIEAENLPLISFVSGLGIRVFVGSEHDVLDRFRQAVRLFEAEYIVRITADCPVIDPAVVDQVVELHLSQDASYTSNIDPPSYPDGLDVEVINRNALERAWQEADQLHEREHVTPYIRARKDLFPAAHLQQKDDLSHHRWTLDRPEDYRFLSEVYERLYADNEYFGMADVLSLLESTPELMTINQGIERNEGYNNGATGGDHA